MFTGGEGFLGGNYYYYYYYYIFNCKWAFARWQWYYNKTQHVQTRYSTQSYTNNKGHITHNEYNAKKK
jgi:hypothetical protein